MHSHMLLKQTNYCTAFNQRDMLEITKMNQKYLLFIGGSNHRFKIGVSR